MKDKKEIGILPASILLSGAILAAAFLLKSDKAQTNVSVSDSSRVASSNTSGAANASVSTSESVLPAVWGNLGKKLVDLGVIDKNKFEVLYTSRGGLTKEQKDLLYGESNGKIVLNEQNAGYYLNLLWALGLANKSSILEKGEMTNPSYGGAGNFASTGGWTLAEGSAMDHYSAHEIIKLTPEQETLVDKVSRNIYRPCCGNSTHFPDCNHGMAMLGLLEIMASQGATEDEMYKTALEANTYWFPGAYGIINDYIQKSGKSGTLSAKDVLGSAYSSSAGLQNISQLVEKLNVNGSSSGAGNAGGNKSPGCSV